MTPDEFQNIIKNNDFLKQQNKKGLKNSDPLDRYETKEIRNAIEHENSDYGGVFDHGRDIHNFKGDTLVVGGGKKSGSNEHNRGITVLKGDQFQYNNDEKTELISNLRSKAWNVDPYTGIEFHTDDERESYIKKLEGGNTLQNEQESIDNDNREILNKYYTINIDKEVQPDLLASITSESDMSKIPDNKFEHILFENVPCEVFINPKLYKILGRITKPGGTINLTVSHACRRLMVPIVEQLTEFGEEFKTKLKEDIYDKPKGRNIIDNPMYGGHILVNKALVKNK